MGLVFDWIVDFSILCLYSLYLFLLSLIFFFFLLTFCLNLSGRDKQMFARHSISCPATLLFFQCNFSFYYFFSFNIFLLWKVFYRPFYIIYENMYIYNILNYVFLRILVYKGWGRKLFWNGRQVLNKFRQYKRILFNKNCIFNPMEALNFFSKVIIKNLYSQWLKLVTRSQCISHLIYIWMMKSGI